MDEEARWWLCSHLMEMSLIGGTVQSDTVLLEEIRAAGARIAAPGAVPEGAIVILKSGGIEISCQVTGCELHETGFRLDLKFMKGFVWTPKLWRPGHLYQPKKAALVKTKKAAGLN